MKKFIMLTAFAVSILLPSLSWAGSAENATRQISAGKVEAYANTLQRDLAARGANGRQDR